MLRKSSSLSQPLTPIIKCQPPDVMLKKALIFQPPYATFHYEIVIMSSGIPCPEPLVCYKVMTMSSGLCFLEFMVLMPDIL